MSKQPVKTFSDDEGFLHTRSNDFGKSPMPLVHDISVTDGACRLYAHMHWRYGSNCKNREGRASMGDFLDVSETTITNRVNELSTHDWIVVIARYDEHGKTHNFYHVFETQEDCLAYRASHQTPKKQVSATPRKSRRGIGGSITHKPKDSSSTQVDQSVPQLKLTSDLNSSSPYPDSGDPDSDSFFAANAAGGNSNSQIAEATQSPMASSSDYPWYIEGTLWAESEYSLDGAIAKVQELDNLSFSSEDIKAFTAGFNEIRLSAIDSDDRIDADSDQSEGELATSARAIPGATNAPTPSGVAPLPLLQQNWYDLGKMCRRTGEDTEDMLNKLLPFGVKPTDAQRNEMYAGWDAGEKSEPPKTTPFKTLSRRPSGIQSDRSIVEGYVPPTGRGQHDVAVNPAIAPKPAKAKKPAQISSQDEIVDPLYIWVARSLKGVDPVLDYNNKRTSKYTWSFVGEIVNREKAALGIVEGVLDLKLRTDVVLRLSDPVTGFVEWYHRTNTGANLPSGNIQKFTEHLWKWYDTNPQVTPTITPHAADYVPDMYAQEAAEWDARHHE